MGSLLSSPEERIPKYEHRYTSSPAYTRNTLQTRRAVYNDDDVYDGTYILRSPTYTTNTVQTQRTVYNDDDVYDSTYLRRFQSLSIGGERTPTRTSYNQHISETRQVTPEVRSIKNSNLLNIHLGWFYSSSVVTYISLSQYDAEYLTIQRKVTNKRNFKIDSIQKIENPYLEKAYELKKEQKEKSYPYVEERLLFHGTTRANVDAICKYNFDWRLCKAHKYGKGVSFSPNSTYASNYSDKPLNNRIMIVAKVLIGKSCIGNEYMELPPAGCDTSQKGDEAIVIVKYEDNEFLPVYKINYHLVNPNVNRRNYNQRKIVTHHDFNFDDLY